MRLTLALLLPLGLAACDSGRDERRDVASTRAVMTGADPVPPGAQPRGAAAYAAALAAPGPHVTDALIARGEQLYGVFCTPCHGPRGQGDGVVVERGFPRPPPLTDERLRAAAPERVVAVITHGAGRMAPFADRMEPYDRWAIAHFVKTLQSSAQP